MVKTKNKYKKLSSTLAEIESRHGDNYQTFLTNAAAILKIKVKPLEKLCLPFRGKDNGRGQSLDNW